MGVPPAITENSRLTNRQLNDIVDALIADRISPEQGFFVASRALRRAHVAIAGIARNNYSGSGSRRLLNSLFDIVAPLRGGLMPLFLEELDYLRGFFRDMPTLSEAQIRARFQLYANHLQQTYWQAARLQVEARGATHHARRLNAGETCKDCIRYAGQGIVRIGTLPPPGRGSVCRSNCNCDEIYYRQEAGKFIEVN